MRFNLTGGFTEFTIPTAETTPTGIAKGSDGNIWFTENSVGKIGKITPAGVITEYAMSAADDFPYPSDITPGPDGALWFVSSGNTQVVGRVTTAGVISEYPLPDGSGPSSITSGPDSALWITEVSSRKITRVGLPDSVPPVVTATPDRAPNAAGWYNDNVTIAWTAVDPSPSSGAPTQPAATVASTEGNHVMYTSAQSCDPAGNCATGSTQISIDKTAPTIAYSLSSQANANGWQNGDVTVTFSCSDALSGLASCSSPITVGEGANQTVSGTATDVAGNTSSVSVVVNVDKTLPTISSVLMPAPNTAGWNKNDVTVGFDCSDLLSGVDSCTNNQVVSTEGTNNQVTGTVVDRAGNSASTTATIKLDKTAPTISYSLSAPANGNGWNNQDVTVTFTCGDALSGLATCSSPVTLGEGANQTVTGTATDVAGNTKIVTVIVNVDKGKPTIAYTVSPVPNAAGWNKSNATVAFTCMDSLSGIASCTSPQTVSTETAGQTVTGTAVDLAGNSQTVTATVKLDKTIPTATNAAVSGVVPLTILGVHIGDDVLLGNTTNITANASDNLSGLSRVEYYFDTDPGQGNGVAMTVSGANASANNVNVSNLHGSHTVYIRSSDIAGNWSALTSATFQRL